MECYLGAATFLHRFAPPQVFIQSSFLNLEQAIRQLQDGSLTENTYLEPRIACFGQLKKVLDTKKFSLHIFHALNTLKIA
jgi:hypothetical protein